jgi:hypothetical protein
MITEEPRLNYLKTQSSTSTKKKNLQTKNLYQFNGSGVMIYNLKSQIIEPFKQKKRIQIGFSFS